ELLIYLKADIAVPNTATHPDRLDLLKGDYDFDIGM
ncbi:hypothetical protein ME3_00547, partial [Bartonella melophagi K-2C]